MSSIAFSVPTLGEIAAGLQPLCCKLVDSGALVANMRRYYGLVCTFIVCTEPATELVLALANGDWWKNASQVLQLASSPDPGQAHDSSHSQALPTTEATIARAKIAEIETATHAQNMLEEGWSRTRRLEEAHKGKHR